MQQTNNYKKARSIYYNTEIGVCVVMETVEEFQKVRDALNHIKSRHGKGYEFTSNKKALSICRKA